MRPSTIVGFRKLETLASYEYSLLQPLADRYFTTIDRCFNFLGKKCFHKLALCRMFILALTGVGILTYNSVKETKENDTMRCYDPEDLKSSDILRDRCYTEYLNQVNRNFHLYFFVLLNSFPVLLVFVV